MAQETRARLIRHEASLRSFGSLFILGGLLGLGGTAVAGLALLVEGPAAGVGEAAVLGGLGFVYALLSGGQLWTGLALRRLQRKARVPATLLAGLSLFSLGIGTLIGGYLLYLLWSEKGKEVLSPAYAEVRAATPEMRPGTSALAWGVLVLLLLFVLLIGVAALAA